jgi:FdhD protein
MMREYPIKKYDKKTFQEKTDQIAIETQFTLYVNQNEIATFLCSPSDQISLGLGYLVSEGVIQQKKDVISINFQELEHFVDITLDPTIKLPEGSDRKKVLTSGCGKGSILLNSLQNIHLPTTDKIVTIPTDSIYSLMREFQMRSELFLTTGCVHSVGLCTSSHILFHVEDIGRHNAVDKILGQCFLKEIPTSDKILLLSGRMAVEIVQKAGRAGVQILLSKSAPTTMAIDMANKIGMTLVGFIRGERMNVYTHSKRIISS